MVNVLGSILLGFLIYNSEYLGYVAPRARMFLGIGFLGSFTTFSTFAVQNFQMPLLNASLNILGNILLAVAGVFAGRGVVIWPQGQEIRLSLTRHHDDASEGKAC